MKTIIIMLLIPVMSVAIFVALAKPDFSYLPAQQREEVSKLYDQADQGDVKAQIMLEQMYYEATNTYTDFNHSATTINCWPVFLYH